MHVYGGGYIRAQIKPPRSNRTHHHTHLVLALKLLLLPLNGRQMRINVGQVRHKRLPGLSLLLLRAVCLAGQPLCILCNQTLLLLHTVNINICTYQ